MTGQPLFAEMVYGFVGETQAILAYLDPGAGPVAIGVLFTMTVGFAWYMPQ